MGLAIYHHTHQKGVRVTGRNREVLASSASVDVMWDYMTLTTGNAIQPPRRPRWSLVTLFKSGNRSTDAANFRIADIQSRSALALSSKLLSSPLDVALFQ